MTNLIDFGYYVPGPKKIGNFSETELQVQPKFTQEQLSNYIRNLDNEGKEQLCQLCLNLLFDYDLLLIDLNKLEVETKEIEKAIEEFNKNYTNEVK